MGAWLSPQSLAALFLTFVFALIALQRPARAVLLYAVLGAAPPLLQIGAFAGHTISQGLLLAEALATVLLFAWVVKRRPGRQRASMPFEGPLLAFLLLACASFLGLLVLPDYRIEGRMTLAVSIGQLLLILWPLAVYLAAAEFLDTTAQLEWLQKIIIGLSVSQLAAPLLPLAYKPYTGWIWSFGIFASPFAMAAVFNTRSMFARLFYVGVALLPFGVGIGTGKAFLYLYVAAAVGTIVWVRASRLVAVGTGAIAAAALIGVIVVGDQLFTKPVQDLLNKERNQSSYGGSSGRGALALDALSIWQEAPFLGVGPGNSYIYMLQRAPIGTPHNQYLNILVEFGVFGLAGWLAFLVVAFRTGLRVYRKTTTPAHKTFVLGWLGMFAGLVVGGVTGDFMIHSIRNGGLELFSGYYLQWVLLGGVVAVDRLERSRAPQTHSEVSLQRPAQRQWRTAPRRTDAARSLAMPRVSAS